jgi:hypothetical protein
MAVGDTFQVPTGGSGTVSGPTSSPQVQPGGAQAPGSGSSGYTFQIPPGFDPSNPVDKLVLDQFQAGVNAGLTDPGSQPTAANMSYWQSQINNTGGATSGNLGYWNNRMTSGRGSGGDPSGGASGGAGGTGGGSGSGFSFDPNSLASNPTLQFITQQGDNALLANKAAMGTVQGTGTQKDLINYGQAAAAQFEPIAYQQANQTFQTNFGDLNALAAPGLPATNAAANYTTGSAAATAGGQVGSANAWMNGINNTSNSLQNAALYNSFNPNPNSTQSGFQNGPSSTSVDLTTVAPGAPGNQGQSPGGGWHVDPSSGQYVYGQG